MTRFKFKEIIIFEYEICVGVINKILLSSIFVFNFKPKKIMK